MSRHFAGRPILFALLGLECVNTWTPFRDPLFEVRGDLVYEYSRATQAKYRIKGNLLYEYGRATQAKFQIRGRLVHEYGKATQAVYEMR